MAGIGEQDGRGVAGKGAQGSGQGQGKGKEAGSAPSSGGQVEAKVDALLRQLEEQGRLLLELCHSLQAGGQGRPGKPAGGE